MIERAALLAAALALAGCVAPRDPVVGGTLCAPETASCPSRAALDRGTIAGRNALDVALSALDPSGGGAARVVVVDVRGAGEATEIASRMMVVEPGAGPDRDFFAPRELGRDTDLELRLEPAEAISARLALEYALIVDPVECDGREDCGGWECDLESGTCAECLPGGDECEAEQTCELGRCTPPLQEGCAAAAAPRPLTLPLLLLALFSILLVRWRRARSARRSFCLPLIALAIAPAPAAAQSVGASFSLAPEAAGWVGEIGQRARVGFGVEALQVVRWRWFGLSVGLGASSFLLKEISPRPPFSGSFAAHHVRFGAQGYRRLTPSIDLFAGAGYLRLGLASNGLFSLTGPRLGYHGAFGALGGRYHLGTFYVGLSGRYDWVRDLPGDRVALGLLFGIGG